MALFEVAQAVTMHMFGPRIPNSIEINPLAMLLISMGMVKAETRAIKSVFGERAKSVSISSTKSMTGHLLGGAGAIEMAACALAIRDGVIPPTINLDNPDEECDLDFTPHTAREKKVSVALNNSFGFGGHNATLVVKEFTG